MLAYIRHLGLAHCEEYQTGNWQFELRTRLTLVPGEGETVAGESVAQALRDQGVKVLRDWVNANAETIHLARTDFETRIGVVGFGGEDA